MAFALQKRCSTTELSRQRGLAPDQSLSLGHGPEQQLGAVAATGFAEQTRKVAFDRAPTDGQGGCDRSVAFAASQFREHAPLGWRGLKACGGNHGERQLP